MNKNNYSANKSQKGATLIVSLVILAVITILGLASMRSSNLELRMAASARDRAVAFQLAESALLAVERTIEKTPFPITSFVPSCAGERCFKPTCPNGLCFSGDLDGAVNRDDCRLARASELDKGVVQHWSDRGYWDTDAPKIDILTQVAEDGELTDVNVQIPYMIEFMCFVPKDAKAIDDAEQSQNSGVPLYRITVQAEGEARRASVMLQSVYRGQ